jgi:DNA-binding HxlR family transcriptional regulator
MNPKCPIESTLSLINGKWKLLILKALSQGPLRYGALEKRISGVSAKVLTQQLREMEKDGLLIRTIFPEVPPRVEYSLDKMAISIFSVFAAMRNWGLNEDRVHEIECSGCAECQPLIR